jgi:hypothetical protein
MNGSPLEGGATDQMDEKWTKDLEAAPAQQE